MANTLSNNGIVDGQTIFAAQVNQIVDSLTGADAYDISISGSLNVDGGVNWAQASDAAGLPVEFVVRSTGEEGELYVTASSAFDIKLSGSFPAERLVITENTSSANAGGLATSNNLRTFNDNNGIVIGGSEGSNGVVGLGLIISEDSGNGNHTIVSDGSGSNLNIRAAGGDDGDTYVVILSDQPGTDISDVFEIAKFGGPLRGTELYHTGSLVFNTAEIGANKGVIITGTVSASADAYLPGLSNTTVPHIVGFDTSSGQLTYYSTASFGGGGSTDTGSLMVTGSVTNNVLTFTKGDGSTFNLTVDTGSAATVDTGSFYYSSSVVLNTITFFQGDGTTETVTVDTGSGGGGTIDTGSFYISSSVNNATITFNQGDGTTEQVTVNNVVSSSYALTSSHTPEALITASLAGSNLTFTKGDSSQFTLALPGGGGGNPITGSYTGSVLTTTIQSINWTGSGVQATVGGANDITVYIPGGGGTNIYNSDGELTGNREVLSVDKSLLFQMSGSSQFLVSDGDLVGTGQTWTLQVDNQGVYLDGLLSNTPTANVVAYDAVTTKLSYFSTSSLKTDITALNNFTGSANLRLDNLEAATSSFVTNDETGSFYYSSSVALNTITFYQGDGTTETVTVDTGSAATINTGSLMVTGSATNNVLTFTKGDGSTFNLTVDTGSAATVDTGSFYISSSVSNATITFNQGDGSTEQVTVNNVNNAVSASYALNLYNSDGTLTGTRRVDLSTYDLTFNNSSAKFIVSGSDRVVFNNLNNTNPGYVVTYDLTGTTGTQGIIGYVTASAFGGTTDTGSLLVTGSVSNATLTFTKGNGSTFPLTVNNVANATTAGSVSSNSVYKEGATFDIWSVGNTFTLLDLGGTNIQVTAPKTSGDGSKLLAVTTMEVYRSSSVAGAEHTTFEYRLYNNTQATPIPGSTRNFSSYMLGTNEGPIPTTFTFTIPIGSGVTSGDTIELQVRESSYAQLGTYSSASISYADLSLVSITD